MLPQTGNILAVEGAVIQQEEEVAEALVADQMVLGGAPARPRQDLPMFHASSETTKGFFALKRTQ